MRKMRTTNMYLGEDLLARIDRMVLRRVGDLPPDSVSRSAVVRSLIVIGLDAMEAKYAREVDKQDGEA